MLSSAFPRSRAALLGALALVQAGLPSLAFADAFNPRIAVIGAGFGGLAACDELVKRGLPCDLYTDVARIGGRVRSEIDQQWGTGLVLNRGAELVDSTHPNILGYAKEYHIPLLDNVVPKGFSEGTFYYRGVPYSEEQVAEKLLKNKDALIKMAQDQAKRNSLLDGVTLSMPGSRAPAWVKQLDSLTVDQYINDLPADDFFKAYFKSGYVSELGVPSKKGGVFTLFDIFDFDKDGTSVPKFLFSNDERYRVLGGTQKITDALARAHASSIHAENKLVSITSADQKVYTLKFQTPTGIKTVEADYVVMAVPTVDLKDVHIDVRGLPQATTAAVEGTNFGRHTKFTMFFKERTWEKYKDNVTAMSDDGFQYWDSSLGQKGKAGSITVYMGDVGEDNLNVAQMEKKLLAQLEKKYPGISKEFLGTTPTSWKHSYSGGTLPGERTTFKHSIQPSGNMSFAGESVSPNQSGYMDGAAGTGKDSAKYIEERIHADRAAARARMPAGGNCPQLFSSVATVVH